MIVEINEVDNENKTPNEQLIELLESFFTQLEADKMFFQFSLNTMLQPRTSEVLKDLISERATFILNSVTSIFNKLEKTNPNILSYMFIAELDGVAINYLAGGIEFPLIKIKQHLIEKYRN